ncbi:uncharacterized protein K452DRAFT_321890 [Aplosporella prunicola CBS 121167]|uniref:Uncharacterized protein n=1 Tax=Aplosporella prunicola CBS 121167 TaxID=1176127 RepID=A0A6A6AZY0_9PEZI|nr:uncharacterized protein K452DRAFT_321890 [Aplosporella prunicola CBS 121167]KAF2137350.1 hypothetical protein K452DRAFT_321890 [Aplosporella prunicola CBS 121167]
MFLLGFPLLGSALSKNGTAPYDYKKMRNKNANQCLVYNPPRDQTIQDCKKICGPAIQKKVESGDTRSTSCLSKLPLGAPTWEKAPGTDVEVAPGKCTCDISFINEAAGDLMKALPIIGEVGCELLTSSLNAAFEVGTLAIPGVGEAIDGGMIASIEAAKALMQVYGASETAWSTFSSWMNPCGDTSAVPQKMQKVFNVFSGADDNVLPKGFDPSKIKNLSKIKKLKGSIKGGNKRYVPFWA